MPKDEKINIKLEVTRDKTTGKLTILAHFDSNAPNVFIDNDDYSWMPTVEEQNLINDAFEFMPSSGTGGTPKKATHESPEKKEEGPKPEPTFEEITPKPKIAASPPPLPVEEPIPTSPVEEKIDIPGEIVNEEVEKSNGLPPLEKKEEDSSVFKITEEETKPDNLDENLEQEIDKEIEKNEKETTDKIDDQSPDTTKSEDSGKDKKEKDNGILVEADQDAIERALKKHKGSEKDEAIVEIDEQMIIDKVLSQKKKGKWAKR